MRLIRWSERYRVDILEVDAEHHALFERIESLAEAAGGNAPPARRLALLEEYVARLRRHVQVEERFLDAIGHDDARAHRDAHRTEVAQLDAICGQARAGRLAVGPSVVTRLADHLERHIRVDDRPLYGALHGPERQVAGRLFREAGERPAGPEGREAAG